MKIVDFSETFAASDLKAGKSRHLIEFMNLIGKSNDDPGSGRSRHLIEFMKVSEY